MSAVMSPDVPAQARSLECDPLRRINFTCEDAGRELESVAAAQRLLLPARLPDVPGLDLAVAYQPARQAGGDFYDFLPLPGGRWGLLIADVSGHGAAAALIAAVVHGMVRACPDAVSPANLLAFVNDRLTFEHRDWRGLFVTAFYGVYDPATRTLIYANAGHPPPRLLRAEGEEPDALDVQAGLPLGIEQNVHFLTGTVSLRTGDVLAMYTDGVTEAGTGVGDWFGVSGLDDAVRRGRGAADAVVSHVLACVDALKCGNTAADDQTVVVTRVG